MFLFAAPKEQTADEKLTVAGIEAKEATIKYFKSKEAVDAKLIEVDTAAEDYESAVADGAEQAVLDEKAANVDALKKDLAALEAERDTAATAAKEAIEKSHEAAIANAEELKKFYTKTILY